MTDPDAPIVHEYIGLGVSWFAAREAHRRSLDELYVWSEEPGHDLMLCAGPQPPPGVSFALSRIVDDIRIHADESVMRAASTERVMIGYRYLPWPAFVAGIGDYGV